MKLRSIEERYLKASGDLAYAKGKKSQIEEAIQDLTKQQAITEKQMTLYTHTQELLLKASSIARNTAVTKIEHLVTLALTAITGLPYQFKISFEQRAGSWMAEFRVVNPQGVVLDPINSMGGGIADICSMALRIAVLEMYEPRVEGPILLDENFKFLSRDYVRRAVEFLHTLHEKTGRQLILVTHIAELAAGADRVFEVVPEPEGSLVNDITDLQETN